MSDFAVAEAANVTPAWLSAVKNDRIKAPPLDKLLAVAVACRVPGRFLTEPLGVIPLHEETKPGDWRAAIMAADRFPERYRRDIISIME